MTDDALDVSTLASARLGWRLRPSQLQWAIECDWALPRDRWRRSWQAGGLAGDFSTCWTRSRFCCGSERAFAASPKRLD